MNGDNFRMVDPETAAWAIKQHMALQDLPLDSAGPSHVTWSSIPPAELRKKLSSPTARVIMDEVCAKHGVLPGDFVSHWRRADVVRARHEFWARCRDEIIIGGAPASWPWIASLTGHDHSSVYRGAKIHRQGGES